MLLFAKRGGVLANYSTFAAKQIKTYNHSRNEKSIADFIDNLDQPYSLLNDKDTRFSYIPKSELNKSFLSLLRTLNIIGTFSEEQDKYKVNHKRK